jgi:hypothetical protein
MGSWFDRTRRGYFQSAIMKWKKLNKPKELNKVEEAPVKEA